MEKPIIAAREPFAVEVTAGQKYFWCACGKSRKQPLCDGSHKGTGIAPMPYMAEETCQLFFCGCKQTAKGPLCDGTHATLQT